MGFGEARQKKSVVIVRFEKDMKPEINLHPVPCFQPLERISGTLNDISQRIDQLSNEKSNA